MGEFVDKVRGLALALGAPGLFLVAFLDSSVLPLPGITDILLVVMVTRNSGRDALVRRRRRSPDRWPAASCCTTSDERAARRSSRSDSPATRSSGRWRALQRNGVMAVLVPSPAAAAGAVQDLRPAGRRRRHQRGEVCHRDRDRPGRPLPGPRRPGGEVRRARRSAYMRENGTVVSIAAVAVLGGRIRRLPALEQAQTANKPIECKDT